MTAAELICRLCPHRRHSIHGWICLRAEGPLEAKRIDQAIASGNAAFCQHPDRPSGTGGWPRNITIHVSRFTSHASRSTPPPTIPHPPSSIHHPLPPTPVSHAGDVWDSLYTFATGQVCLVCQAKRRKMMNAWDWDGCQKNLITIAKWMLAEAKKHERALDLEMAMAEVRSVLKTRIPSQTSAPGLEVHRSDLQSRSAVKHPKIAVFTCILNGYDDLRPIQPDPNPNVTFHLFTDEAPADPKGWTVHIVPKAADSYRAQRRIKIMAHEYFSDADWTVWLDGCVKLKQPPSELLTWLTEGDQQTEIFLPSTGGLPNFSYEMGRLRKDRYADAGLLEQQQRDYKAAGLPEEPWGWQTWCLVRRNSGTVRDFNIAWQAEIEKYTHRDQPSFGYLVWKRKAPAKMVSGSNWGKRAMRERGHRKPHTFIARRSPPAPEVTAILLNWKRPDNLTAVIAGLRAQTVPVAIWLWDNAGLDSRANSADLIVRASENLRVWPRWLLATLARTPYILSMDDDLAIAKPNLIENCLAYIHTHPGKTIIGAFGVELRADKNYKDSNHVGAHPKRDRQVDILKNRFMFLPRDLLAAVTLCAKEEDIRVSSFADQCLVPKFMHGAFRELPAPHAACTEADHWARRNAAAKEYFTWPSRAKVLHE